MANLLDNCKDHLNSLEKRQSEIHELINKLSIKPTSILYNEQTTVKEPETQSSIILAKTQNAFKNFTESYKSNNNSIVLKKTFEKIIEKKISQSEMKNIFKSLGGVDKIYSFIKAKNFEVITRELEKIKRSESKVKFEEVLLQPRINDKLTITTSYIGQQNGDRLGRKGKKLSTSFASPKRERSGSLVAKKPMAARSTSKYIKGSVKEILKEKTHKAFDAICKDAKSSKASPKNHNSGLNRNPPLLNLHNASKLSESVKSKQNDEKDVSKTLNPKFNNKNDISRSFASNQNKESLSRSLSPNQPIEFKVSPPSSQKRKFDNKLAKVNDKKILSKTINSCASKKRPNSAFQPSSTQKSFNKTMYSVSKNPKPSNISFRGANYKSFNRSPKTNFQKLDSSFMKKNNQKTFKDILADQKTSKPMFKSKTLARPASHRNIKVRKPTTKELDKKSDTHSKSAYLKLNKGETNPKKSYNPSTKANNTRAIYKNESQNNSVINKTHSELRHENSMNLAGKKGLHQKTPSFNYKRPSSYNACNSRGSFVEKKSSVKKIVRISKETSPYAHKNQPVLQSSQASLTNLSKTHPGRKSNCLMNSSKSDVKEDDKNNKFIFETSLRNNAVQDRKIAKDLEIINHKPHRRHYPQFDQFYFNNKVLEF